MEASCMNAEFGLLYTYRRATGGLTLIARRDVDSYGGDAE
jgi:hypothetical protein